jgi:predicted Holliday junction resolvase-like endonuclease
MFGVIGFIIMLSIIVIGFILYVYKLSEKIEKLEMQLEMLSGKAEIHDRHYWQVFRMHAQSLNKLETKIKELSDESVIE